jgi:hypothetical protein
MELAYSIAFVMSGCLLIAAFGFTWSQMLRMKHAMKVQALELETTLNKYADIRKIVYKTEHTVQSLEKMQTHLVNSSVHADETLNAMQSDVSLHAKTLVRLKEMQDIDRKDVRQLEAYTHKHLNDLTQLTNHLKVK